MIELGDDTSIEQAVDRITAALEGAELSFGQGAESAEQEAIWLVLHACGVETMEDLSWGQKLEPQQGEVITSSLRKRIQGGQPMAYVLRQTWFAGFNFYVDERVIIPRSFISEWIPERFSPWIDAEQVETILDMCCGSGCIGIAAALELENARVTLSDVSEDAVMVAQINIERHKVGNRVTTHCGDRFEGLDQRFDLILCNPPYVSSQRMATLPEEFRAEPELALKAGDDGLEFIAPFFAEVRDYLTDRGHAIVEAGSASAAVEKTWPEVPFTWLGTEFDERVLLIISAAELDQFQSHFKSAGGKH
ncbi:MAG: 50S ribosomal protein L3 N(5)-glutamine methyltransferase [Gammaproteobacteria bacterium]|jgi:ribosomal protein L3 glutamine methyltransferase